MFLVAGYVISLIAGTITSDGFKLEGYPVLVWFAVIALYFYLGREWLGGTIWQRLLKAR